MSYDTIALSSAFLRFCYGDLVCCGRLQLACRFYTWFDSKKIFTIGLLDVCIVYAFLGVQVLSSQDATCVVSNVLSEPVYN